MTDLDMTDIDRAANLADESFATYAALPPEHIAAFLEKIGEEILAIGDVLLETASRESALPIDRLTGERMRTVNQLRMFAEMARQNTWRATSVDRALPDRKPLRRPDLRRTSIPVGPVAVWAASNFPLAFSVAGGDTASALAAGCPVIVKAHPGHPATSELVAQAIAKAVAQCGLPSGVFSMVSGASPEVSLELVRHPKIAAGAFTGSLRAGRALFDAANQRPVPIPFFAEMGSVNPVFLLPGALRERAEALADGLTQSVNMGVGQFCTCPGVAPALAGEGFSAFAAKLRDNFAKGHTGTMLTPAIASGYRAGVEHLSKIDGVKTTHAQGALSALFETDAATFLQNEDLGHELFGPSTVVVECSTRAELEKVACHLEGTLTATIHGTVADLEEHRWLIPLLARKTGRLLFNGYPTGVEVCASMQHGGPYPATTDPRFTSVGSAAIYRFTRPICFQDFPQEFLPAEIRD